MNNVFVGFALAGIFLICWILQFVFSKLDGRFDRFQNHFMAFTVDWIFLPFNLAWPFAVSLTTTGIVIAIVAGIVGTIYMHNFWSKINAKNIEDSPFFKKSSNKLTRGGVVHYVYSLIQVPIVFLFAFNNVYNKFSYMGLGLLVLFLFLGFYSSKRIHGKVVKQDAILLILSIILLILGFFII